MLDQVERDTLAAYGGNATAAYASLLQNGHWSAGRPPSYRTFARRVREAKADGVLVARLAARASEGLFRDPPLRSRPSALASGEGLA
jgi:hypothetical protein